MIRSAVTISLVEEARGGPFVFWHDLAGSCRMAKALGFDAVEIFPPGPEAVDPKELRSILDGEGLALAAVGTGAGWVKHRLHLTLPGVSDRLKARDFIRSIIDFAGPLGAPAIIGSMQGRSGNEVDYVTAMEYLREALSDLGNHAKQYCAGLLFEPLNRYETDLVNTIDAGVSLLYSVEGELSLLADLFHMNIEEADIASAIRSGKRHFGFQHISHIHFVDSNRRPAGYGHIDYAPIVAALRQTGYHGYVSAEALSFPNPEEAARQTIRQFRHFFPA